MLSSTSLLSLDIQNNHIGDEGAAAFAGALTGTTTLEFLDLGGCGVTSEGVKSIAAMLPKNTTLRTLKVSARA